MNMRLWMAAQNYRQQLGHEKKLRLEMLVQSETDRQRSEADRHRLMSMQRYL